MKNTSTSDRSHVAPQHSVLPVDSTPHATGSSDLTWSLVIATYNRPEPLVRALRSAASQTRPPREIIVVDSSPNAAQTSKEVLSTLGTEYPDIAWKYIVSRNRSAAIQRNEGLELCEADIVFFIDDDCVMYPDYAQIILETYKADKDGRLAGVAGLPVDAPPPTVSAEEYVRPKRARRPLWSRIKWHLKDKFNHYVLMNTSLGHFYPYTGKYPDHPLPELPPQYRIIPLRLFSTCRATFPRNIACATRFDDDLLYYSVAEDLDITYRASLSGPLCMVMDAMVYHEHHPTARPKLRTVTRMAILNHAFFIQKNNPRSVRVKLGYGLKVLRRLLAEFIFDVVERDPKFPRFLGTLEAIPDVLRVFSRRGPELGTWYRELQHRIYNAQNPGSAGTGAVQQTRV